MATTTFFPPVSDVVRVDQLPEQLGFLKEKAQEFLDQTFYKDFQFTKSPNGETSFYNISLISFNRLAVTFPGLDISLVFNPNVTGVATSFTEIPLSISFQWKILNYIKSFKQSEFANDPAAIFDLATSVLGLSQRQMLEEAIFSMTPDGTADVYAQFVQDANDVFGPGALNVPAGTDPVGELLNQINTNLGENATVAVFTVYIASSIANGTFNETIDRLFKKILGGQSFSSFLKDLLIPKIEATIETDIGIEFPRNLLIPLDDQGEPLPEVDPETNFPIRSTVIWNLGEFFFSTERGIGFDTDISGSLSHKSQIGNTGLTIDFAGAKLDMSRKTNIIEADLDGRPNDFVGVYIEEASIGFPPFWSQDPNASNAEVFGEKLLIGTGGLSGRIGLRSEDQNAPLLQTNFGKDEGEDGFSLSLDSFDIQFQQGSITSSDINGTLVIPGFCKVLPNGDHTTEDAVVKVNVNFNEDGEVLLTAIPVGDSFKVCIKDVLNFTVSKINVGKRGDRFFLKVSGKIEFTFDTEPLASFLPGELDIKDLVIWSDGQIELPEAGSLPIPNPPPLKLGPVELSVTNIHIGSEERFRGGRNRRYKYVGFDGGLNINPGGVDARGSGIKIFFSTDQQNDPSLKLDVFFKIEGIAIDITIPGEATEKTLIARLKGFVKVSEDAEGKTEYQGGLSVDLPKIKLSGAASMRYKPGVPSFLVDMELFLGKPIPLGPTGLGIYGFRGLFGQQYVADKEAAGVDPNDTNWYPYYKSKVAQTYLEGIHTGKFDDKGGFTVGAGVALATQFDSGKVFSTKIMLMLSANTFFLQGQATILSDRLGLDTQSDPPFGLILTIDDDSVFAGISVNFLLPKDEGTVIDIKGDMKLEFFFRNPRGWYINIGEPDDRIRAKVLSLFDADAFLNLSVQGIRMGAGAGFDIKYGGKAFGILGNVRVDVGANMSFTPFQVGAFVALGGGIELRIFGIPLGFEFFVGLAVEAPKPTLICGNFEACMKVPFLGKGCVKGKFNWVIVKSQEATNPVIFMLDDEQAAQAVHMLTEETYPVLVQGSEGSQNSPASNFIEPATNLNIPIIPIDSFIALEFFKGVKASDDSSMNKIGGAVNRGYRELIPPQAAKGGNAYHEYTVEEINIYTWNPGVNQWSKDNSQGPYHVYDALTPFEAQEFISTAVNDSLKFGWFQRDDPEQTNRVLMLASSPVNFLQFGSGPIIYENYGMSVEKLFCPPFLIEKFCHPTDEMVNATLVDGQTEVFPSSGMLLTAQGGEEKVVTVPNGFGFTNGLCLSDDERIEIKFPVASGEASLKLVTENQVKVSYYTTITDPVNVDEDGLPILIEQLIKEEVYGQVDLLQEVTYNNTEKPLTRILIENIPGETNTAVPTSCDLIDPNQAGELLNTLNCLTQGSPLPLTTGDINNGNKLILDNTIITCLPPSIPACELHMEYVRNALKTWSVRIRRARGRTGRIKSMDLVVNGAVYHLSVSVNSKSSKVIKDALVNYIQNNFVGLLSVTSTGNKTFDVTAVDPSMEFFRIDNASGFRAIVTEDTGVSFNYNNVISFNNLVLDNDSAVEGTNYGFRVTAVMMDASEAILSGTTDCFPLTCCEGETTSHYLSLCLDIEKQLVQLTSELSQVCSELEISEVQCAIDGQNGCEQEASIHCERVKQLIPIKTDLQTQVASLQTYFDTYCINIKDKVCDGTIPLLGGNSYLLETCWLKQTDSVYNSDAPSNDVVVQNTQALIDRIQETIQPVWRPNTTFCMQVKIQDYVDDRAPNKGGAYRNIFFKTQGPVGHFHQDVITNPDNPTFIPQYQNLLAQGASEDFRLADLKEYVDYNRSYPNADGSIIQAKPLYYINPRLLLFFTKTYMYNMFNGFIEFQNLEELPFNENRLDVIIQDPASEEAIEIDDENKTWERSVQPVLTRDMELLLNLLENNPCYSGELVPPSNINYEVLIPELEPEKLYNAIYSSKYKGTDVQVHRYNFQTSVYSGFVEHVNSYKLVDAETNEERDAIFDLKLETSTGFDIIKAQQIIAGTLPDSDPLVTQFMQPYDRFMSGALQITGLEAPVTTEFNLIRDYSNDNPTSDHIIGILVRSPEPFSDPKIPFDELVTTISVVTDSTGDTLHPDFVEPGGNGRNTIISKDGASWVLGKWDENDLNITDKTLFIKFEYKEPTRDGFITLDEVTQVIELNVAQTASQLIATDCMRAEVELTDTLQAELITDIDFGVAERYDFYVDGPGVNEILIKENANGVLPLGELTGLDYNRTYEVKVKNIVNGRLSNFGQTCFISTRQLAFIIQDDLPAFVYDDETLDITINLQFLDESIFAYNGQIRLKQDIDGNVIDNDLTVVDGIAQTTLSFAQGGTLTLTLEDIDDTLYEVTDQKVIPISERATQVVITDGPSGNIVPGSGTSVTLQAQGPNGILDLGYVDSVQLDLTGSATPTSAVVNFVGGELTHFFGNTLSEIVDLNFSNSGTGLILPASFTVQFVNPNNEYIIEVSTPQDTNTNSVITVKAVGIGTTTVDVNFNIDIEVQTISPNVTGLGTVNIVNGVGTLNSVQSSIAQTVDFTLSDINGTGLSLGTGQIVFVDP